MKYNTHFALFIFLNACGGGGGGKGSSSPDGYSADSYITEGAKTSEYFSIKSYNDCDLIDVGQFQRDLKIYKGGQLQTFERILRSVSGNLSITIIDKGNSQTEVCIPKDFPNTSFEIALKMSDGKILAFADTYQKSADGSFYKNSKLRGFNITKSDQAEWISSTIDIKIISSTGDFKKSVSTDSLGTIAISDVELAPLSGDRENLVVFKTYKPFFEVIKQTFIADGCDPTQSLTTPFLRTSSGGVDYLSMGSIDVPALLPDTSPLQCAALKSGITVPPQENLLPGEEVFAATYAAAPKATISVTANKTAVVSFKMGAIWKKFPIEVLNVFVSGDKVAVTDYYRTYVSLDKGRTFGDAIVSNSSHTKFTLGNTKLFRTNNAGGFSWSDYNSTFSTASFTPTRLSVAFSSVSESGTFYVVERGTGGSLYLHTSPNNGSTWAESQITAVSTNPAIRDVFSDGINVLIFTEGDNFYKSGDSGNSWTTVPYASGRTYVSSLGSKVLTKDTSAPVKYFVSTNLGVTFSQVTGLDSTSGAPFLGINSLYQKLPAVKGFQKALYSDMTWSAVNPNYDSLFAGTKFSDTFLYSVYEKYLLIDDYK